MSAETKKLVLAIIAVSFIGIFFNIGYYKKWINKKVIDPLGVVSAELQYMDPEERKMIRYGNTYLFTNDARKYLEQLKQDTNAVILVPPKAYFKQMGIDFHAPEPITIYYFSGLRAKWTNSPGVEQCNFMFMVRNKELALMPIPDTTHLREILALYEPYKPGL